MAGIIQRVVCRGLSWTSLRVYGSSSIVKSSYVWFIAIPMIARLYSTCNEENNSGKWYCERIIEFDLPFNWKMAFYGAVLFAIATFIYQIFCPHIIKNYKSYEEFSKSGRGVGYLIWSLTVRYGGSLQSLSSRRINDLTSLGLNFGGKPGKLLNRKVHYEVIAQNQDVAPKQTPILFWYVCEHLDFHLYKIRSVVLCLYVLGTILFGIIIIENLNLVFEYVVEFGWF